MQIDLTGKSVLLGVTGSISAYKACDLARLFVKAGAEVHVVMSPSAERFVSALTFEALTRNPVLTEQSESWASEMNHIELGKKCDVFVIAPATANTINKIAQGIADNILTQTALAFKDKILIAPAANTQMLAKTATCNAMTFLQDNGYSMINPQDKLLACGDVGSGALAEPTEIFFEVAKALCSDPFWKDRSVIVTGGGTREKLDEVRYISNFSSGKMAKSLCIALYLRGANVTYISTMGFDELPAAMTTIEANDAQDILEATQQSIQKVTTDRHKMKTPYIFMVAAVADFTPKAPQSGKLKKSMLGDTWHIELKQTTDVLASIDKSAIKTVGFKAEMDTQEGLNNAAALLDKKGVDAVCYNLLKDAKSFGGNENEITFITKDTQVSLGRADKLTLSNKILDEAKKLIHEEASNV
ncbi:bifunctional phosphopantothenoylcysteine decarboxylase/phosphopantothenate--cysteine ligase CoaBC [Sulfurovum sp. XGS-02]|uniref:bifunctional phosphopantothenoylcysteine decarboxylase/phosphopantothenate--cysteine ligase CoaBC n=1 Tax=Sulfurovum sp. XGS-02 TaxID=2925411 RepID=UPI0020479A5F|nr:bifunctional phosphopantothenoylcysteine decarboxylase/phosphopantothenate--cysteine ligase CoaBC [Sulfurovum sp. XGS-02]UPT77060.1 bifunctional phosphopantothenoylcysteine decarboxylase/phosphopantothenate--cysteine ligase CoaBC [Sulfurovum sp. XGS-02]